MHAYMWVYIWMLKEIIVRSKAQINVVELYIWLKLSVLPLRFYNLCFIIIASLSLKLGQHVWKTSILINMISNIVDWRNMQYVDSKVCLIIFLVWGTSVVNRKRPWTGNQCLFSCSTFFSVFFSCTLCFKQKSMCISAWIIDWFLVINTSIITSCYNVIHCRKFPFMPLVKVEVMF